MKICLNCGFETEAENARFCLECGTKLTVKNTFPDKIKVEDGVLVSCLLDDERIVLPEGIRVIKESAFKNNRNVKSITLPNGVTEIQYKAFYHVPSLTHVFIPKTVTKIADDAFYNGISYATLSPDDLYFGCLSLVDIEVDGDNPVYKTIDGNLYTKDGKCLLRYAPGKKETCFAVPEGVRKLGCHTFLGAMSLRKIVLPSTFGDDEFIFFMPPAEDHYIDIEISKNNPLYTAIDGNVYSTDKKTFVMYNFTKDEDTFIIPKTVTRIDNCAFSDSSLETVVIPSGVSEIGESAFQGCNSLENVALPTSLRVIDSSAFAGCENITSIALPNTLDTIGAFAFEGTGLKTVTIPVGIKEIDEYAFSGSALTDVTIPSSIKKIGNYCFSECYDLASVILSDGPETIGEGAFSECGSLTSIRIPASVKEIGADAFADCDSLKTVYVASGKKYDNLPSNAKTVNF